MSPKLVQLYEVYNQISRHRGVHVTLALDLGDYCRWQITMATVLIDSRQCATVLPWNGSGVSAPALCVWCCLVGYRNSPSYLHSVAPRFLLRSDVVHLPRSVLRWPACSVNRLKLFHFYSLPWLLLNTVFKTFFISMTSVAFRMTSVAGRNWSAWNT